MSLPDWTREEIANAVEKGSKRAKVFHTKGHARQRLEKYYTPAWCTELLLRHLDLTRVTYMLEPAAGDGGIVDVLKQRCVEDGKYIRHIHGMDVAPERADIETRDFFKVSSTPANAIITNPPFGAGGKLAYQFCWHALRLMEPRHGLVAMLLRDDFDSAGGRRELFQHPAFDRKIVMLERIRWTNLEQKAAGPSGSHAWFVWDWSRRAGPPTLHYAGRS